MARDGLKLNYPQAELRRHCSIEDGDLGGRGRARRRIVHTTVVGAALGVAAITSVVVMRGTFVGAVISAAISCVSVVVMIPVVVLISVVAR